MSLLLTILLLLPLAMAHMQMSWPPPLRSKYNPATPENLIDYSMTAPLDASGANFPCKGYHTNTPKSIVATYTAGSSYNITLEGTATHGGGSCQLSLSYDNGKTFKVIKSMIGGCPLQSSYDFTVPADAPSGDALFAWSWSNNIGNREFYMNCANVHVDGRTTYKRDEGSAIDGLPNIWVAELASINKCKTNGPNGRLNAVYPNPGPDVVYGSGMSSSDPPTPGECEVPLAGRQVLAPSFTFDPQITTTTQPASSIETSSNSLVLLTTLTTVTDFPTSTPSTLATSSRTSSERLPSVAIEPSSSSTLQPILPTTTSASNPAVSSSAASNSAASVPTSLTTSAASRSTFTNEASLSTTTITMDCPATITMSMASSSLAATYTVSAPVSACTGTSALCPCNIGYSCLAIGACTWACMAMPNTATPSFQTSRIPASVTSATSSAVLSSIGDVQFSALPTTSSAPATPSQTPGEPSYVNPNDLRSYLPCMPGTFICTDPSTWYTCDQTVSGTWTYQYPRQVAAGMQCKPYLHPGTTQFGQQGNTPQNFYRDDQYVRASFR